MLGPKYLGYIAEEWARWNNQWRADEWYVWVSAYNCALREAHRPWDEAVAAFAAAAAQAALRDPLARPCVSCARAPLSGATLGTGPEAPTTPGAPPRDGTAVPAPTTPGAPPPPPANPAPAPPVAATETHDDDDDDEETTRAEGSATRQRKRRREE
mmetsp:Transcript_66343/g.192222  ORF Transcript_66343/g.192222 Transcript_66343/m.192222 type:complete len:156 (-) Transcript_66343:43-510(-)